MKKEPKRIKMSETPSVKDVKRIPMPSLSSNPEYLADQDCPPIYTTSKNENSEQNNS